MKYSKGEAVTLHVNVGLLMPPKMARLVNRVPIVRTPEDALAYLNPIYHPRVPRICYSLCSYPAWRTQRGRFPRVLGVVVLSCDVVNVAL